MSTRRLELLDAMELGPVWRLRRREATPAAVQKEPLSAEPTTPPAAVDEIGRAERIARMSWDALEAAVRACDACSLSAARTQAVFGVGPLDADWMLVGEAPGAEEDRRGEPFVGAAGQLLDNMLAAIGLNRQQQVYIANVLKCRPPANRNPDAEEVAECAPYLARQVELVQPRLLIAMGRFAAQTLLNTDASIASLRGKRHAYNGVPLIVTYHPAYLLRSPADKAKAWEDLCFARATMRELGAATAASR